MITLNRRKKSIVNKTKDEYKLIIQDAFKYAAETKKLEGGYTPKLVMTVFGLPGMSDQATEDPRDMNHDQQHC